MSIPEQRVPDPRSDQWEWINSWGRDGWDMGEPPYTRYAKFNGFKVYAYLCYCEGDYTVRTFESRDLRDRALDEAALFHWKDRAFMRDTLEMIAGPGRSYRDVTVDELPAWMRGPFSWDRLTRETEAH